MPVPWTISGVLGGTLVCDSLPRISLPPAPFHYSPSSQVFPLFRKNSPGRKPHVTGVRMLAHVGPVITLPDGGALG